MKKIQRPFFSGLAWKHFRKNKPAFISLYLLLAFLLIAVLAPVIANDKPLFVKYNGRIYFPAFSFSNTLRVENKKTGEQEVLLLNNIDWSSTGFEKIVRAPIPYAPGKSNPENADYNRPSAEHFFGTAKNGSDVFAGLIHGTRISISIGVLSMLLASLIGISLGALAGYFGDFRLQTTRGKFLMTLIGILPSFFYASALFRDSGLIQFMLSCILFIFLLLIFYRSGSILDKIPFFSKKIFVRIDSFVSRALEIFISIPRLILIITIAAVSKPSYINIILIIGLTSWTEIARFVRAELLHSTNSEYIETARAIGLPDIRVILKHALPNALAPATVAIVFGIASAILTESGLSFLGIGVPQDVTTWGSLLSAGKENFEAWWLVVFPGLAIFLTVTAFNLAGDGLRDAMDVRTREY